MENWIEINDDDYGCELTFHDCLHVVLDDDDVEYLIGLLKGYQFKNKEYELA